MNNQLSGATAFGELAELKRWLLWKEFEQPDGTKRKKPFSFRSRAASPREASSTDSADWGTLADVLAEKERHPGWYGGVGIALGDLGTGRYLVGVDLDTCLTNGELTPWAAEAIEVLGTYGEQSPSGIGIKPFFTVAERDLAAALAGQGIGAGHWGRRRTIGAQKGPHGPAFEIYFRSRFFTVTGRHWAGTPDRINEVSLETLQQVAAIVERVATDKRKPDRRRGDNRDNSRSGAAFRKALELQSQGGT